MRMLFVTCSKLVVIIGILSLIAEFAVSFIQPVRIVRASSSSFENIPGTLENLLRVARFAPPSKRNMHLDMSDGESGRGSGSGSGSGNGVGQGGNSDRNGDGQYSGIRGGSDGRFSSGSGRGIFGRGRGRGSDVRKPADRDSYNGETQSGMYDTSSSPYSSSSYSSSSSSFSSSFSPSSPSEPEVVRLHAVENRVPLSDLSDGQKLRGRVVSVKE